jgi:hypothetical protein
MQERLRPASSTRTLDTAASALPLDPEAMRPPPPRPLPETRTSDRIRAALLRWLEEEL